MNKTYPDKTDLDHVELASNENNLAQLHSGSSLNPSEKRLTELALVDSLRLHLRTSNLFEELLSESRAR